MSGETGGQAPAGRESEAWIWSRYWHYDRIASCMDGPSRDNYDDRTAAGWRDFFGALPDGQTILDLCTGNGAIALLAVGVSQSQAKDFSIVAVDQADIDPPAFVSRYQDELRAIQFRGGVNVEHLPLGNGEFGAVTSQFGLEYSDLSKSLPEAMRVLRPGGAFRFVMHAAEGLVGAEAALAIKDADVLLRDVDLPETAKRCIAAVTHAERAAAATTGDHDRAAAALRAFEAAVSRTLDYIPEAGDKEMVRNVGFTLFDTYKKREHFDVGTLISKVDEVRAEVVAHRARSAALVNAAHAKSEAQGLADALKSHGAKSADVQEIRAGDALMAYALSGSR